MVALRGENGEVGDIAEGVWGVFVSGWRLDEFGDAIKHLDTGRLVM